jgi:hypothetical protein
LAIAADLGVAGRNSIERDAVAHYETLTELSLKSRAEQEA